MRRDGTVVMDAPLSRHLARFSSPRSAAGPATAWLARGAVGSATGTEPQRPSREGAAEAPLAAARAEGRAEGRLEGLAQAKIEAEAAAEARLAARLGDIEAERVAEAERHRVSTEAAIEAAVARAREEWAASGSAALLPRLDEGLAALHGRLAEGLAAALRPLLAGAVAERALLAFVAALDQLLADPARPAVLVRGPAALVAALRAARGAAPGVTFEDAADMAELVLLADGARVETRLAAALASLAGDTPTDQAERDA